MPRQVIPFPATNPPAHNRISVLQLLSDEAAAGVDVDPARPALPEIDKLVSDAGTDDDLTDPSLDGYRQTNITSGH
jgi:hypothetical protein